MQKQRFRLYRRNGTYYAHGSDTGKQTSLRTKLKEEAIGMIAARNQAAAQPVLNVAMAKVYLSAKSPELLTRTWGELIERMLQGYTGATPRLSSYWVHLVTPIPAAIAQPLIKGLGNEVIVHDETALRLFPDVKLLDFETSVQLAMNRMKSQGVETSWSDALTSSQGARVPLALINREGMIIEQRQRKVAAPAAAVYRSFATLGGQRGWLYMDWAWQLRGVLDRLCGGVGMRRGRRDPEELRVGDSLDFWRVEMVEPGKLIRLRAEMKVPGRAWLEFESRAESPGSSLLLQSAFFEPKGLLGLLYWYVLYPFHSLIFSGLVRIVAENALH